MPTLDTLPTPCLLLDLDRFERNCARMRERARAAGVRLRPHLKTLKSADAAAVAVDESRAITVSTLTEAGYFARHGFGDITCAVCLPAARAPQALAIHRGLARQHEGAGLAFLVDDLAVVREIAAHVQAAEARGEVPAGAPLPLWIEIDCGGHRTGLVPDHPTLVDLARHIVETPPLELRGVLTHAGQSYGCRSVAEIQAVAEAERAALVDAAARIRAAGLPCPGTSAGSTPTAVHGRSWAGVTELRPGVYMAGDLFQAHVGSMSADDIAVSVLATVTSVRGDRLVIDAGGLALSKDRSLRGEPGDPGYGSVHALDGRPLGLRVDDVHQEHGVVVLPAGATAPAPGTRVRVLPNHACMTAAAHPRYHLVRGGAVVGEWPRIGGWD